MSMVTRCPSCATLFRITPQQLQAHHGQVRCGRCLMVFDGFNGLATLPDQSAPEAVASVQAEAVATPVHTAPLMEPASQTQVDRLGATAGLSEATVVPPSAPSSSGEVPQERSLMASATQTVEGVPPIRRHGSPLWSAGVAVLLALLVGQAAYAYRIELVASYPGLKTAVAHLCGLLGCSVPLPQRPTLINIEASDLQVLDPLRPSVIQLTATLRNHAGYEVGFPALDLVLTNTKEHTLARRIFMPDEYLETRRAGSAGFVANAEITVRLVLDTGGLGAAGFRLALLPAQSR